MAAFQLDEIIVSDDFVPATLRRDLNNLVSGPIWQYGHRSNGRRDRFCFWNAHFAGGSGSSRKNCEEQLAANSACEPVWRLWKLLEQGVLNGHEPLRVYANAHTYGVEGYVHQDNKDTENYYSTIYYAHPVWHKNWCGDIVFYTPDGQDILRSVYPKPGRAVSFHGSIHHCARAPSRDCSELRISIVIKTQMRGS